MHDNKTEIVGLSSAEVKKRVDLGQVNIDTSVKTRSIKRIVYDNVCTLFNAINVVLAIIIAFTGVFRNMLFMGVIICNTAIGIIQEVRSKKTTDKLTIVAAAKVAVIRDGKRDEIPVDSIVLDDVIVLGRGDQVPSDCDIINGSADVNESLLTGESDLIPKSVGDRLMSGSFINSGTVYARVVHVGADNYATKITAEAKKHKKVNSEIMDTMNGLIRFVSIVIFPLGIILFCKSYFLLGNELISSISTTTSAMIGMIPEGLILLTSTVLAVSVIRLSKYQVLVQQLYCIETLARVDTLCLDKTGTITSGKMVVDKVVPIEPKELSATESEEQDLASLKNFEQMVNSAFASIAYADEDKNETGEAIYEYYKSKSKSDVKIMDAVKVVPFSSDKKWSGAVFANGKKGEKKSFVMGATQFIIDTEKFSKVNRVAQKLATDARVLLLAQVEGFDENNNIIGEPQPLGFICIQDEIRKTAPSTIKFFADEGVDLKVISGDDPRTVSGIAKKVGIKNADKFCDATTLVTDAQINDAIEKYSVFGRVKPEQKKAFVVALQKHGHTVAMTGDGVNDTLALKQADCSVAMAAGSSAARNVAHLVLIDNDFAAMTQVVAEGRRSINNLQRSASLFLTKTLLCMGLGILFLFAPFQYPFQPIQMTLISSFTIGLPSFVLALEPNHDRIKGKFLINVIVKSIPSATMAILSIAIINYIGYFGLDLEYNQISTMCVLMTSLIGITLICRLSWPFTKIRIALIVVVIAGTLLAAFFLADLFFFTEATEDMVVLFCTTAAIAIFGFFFLYNNIDKWYQRKQAELV